MVESKFHDTCFNGTPGRFILVESVDQTLFGFQMFQSRGQIRHEPMVFIATKLAGDFPLLSILGSPDLLMFLRVANFYGSFQKTSLISTLAKKLKGEGKIIYTADILQNQFSQY